MKNNLQIRDKFMLYILAGLGVCRAIDLAFLGGFNNFVYTRKRLYYMEGLKLIASDYLNREKIYYLTSKGYNEIERMHRTYTMNHTTYHDVEVARIATYLYLRDGISYRDILTDRQMKYVMKGSNIHRPDLVVGSIAYEYERTIKTWARLKENIRVNGRFARQVWVVPDDKTTLQDRIVKFARELHLDNVEVMTLGSVNELVVNADIKQNVLRNVAVCGERDFAQLTRRQNADVNKYLR